MKKISISNLVIELTRHCNMACSHCLRGKQENIDMDLKYIKTLFKKINYIDSIIFTGGEPSLKPELIDKVIDYAKEFNVSIDNFYIATNGKNISNKFLTSIIKLYSYCKNNEISAVEMSIDQFHKEEFEGKDSKGWKKLSVFNFFRPKHEVTPKTLLNEGKAIDWGGQIDVTCDTLLIREDNDSIDIMDAMIYLNCKGNLIAGCNFSYESQEKKENIICHVNNFCATEIKKFHNSEMED